LGIHFLYSILTYHFHRETVLLLKTGEIQLDWSVFYERRFYDAHRRWRASRHLDDINANYPTLRYVLLHTFSHALMRQLTLT
jgi:hypothetical protein